MRPVVATISISTVSVAVPGISISHWAQQQQWAQARQTSFRSSRSSHRACSSRRIHIHGIRSHSGRTKHQGQRWDQRQQWALARRLQISFRSSHSSHEVCSSRPIRSQRPLLPLIPTLTLMLGTATMATDTVDMDMVATTGPMATTVTTERGQQTPSLSPLLPLSPTLMLIPGTAMDTVATDGADTTDLMATTAMADTATGDTAATTAHMDMGVTGEVTGAKQTNRVDSSSDCDFPSTLASISRACA